MPTRQQLEPARKAALLFLKHTWWYHSGLSDSFMSLITSALTNEPKALQGPPQQEATQSATQVPCCTES